MFSFFSQKKKNSTTPITTDVHSHLLAQLDDGVKSESEALEILNIFMDAGFTKVITTPHVMSDYYKNTPLTINTGLQALTEYLKDKGSLVVEAAAEYYLDEYLLKQAEGKDLLTFGDRHLLFETNFFSEPLHLRDFIFKATSTGYKPVMAHPERYQYMTLKKAEDLRDRGVLFQINTLSLMGYYSMPVQKMAQQLIEKGWVDLLGSDCHTLAQAQLLQVAWKSKYYQRALNLPLLNHSI